MLIDYHIHAVAHGEYDFTSEWIKQFMIQATKKNIKEIGFSEHDEFVNKIDLSVVNNTKEKIKDIDVKLGLEVDYIPDREEYIKQLTINKNYDYIIGSLHFINGWGFDHPDNKHTFDTKPIDNIYENYFDLLISLVESNLFDIVGHLDLIKIWGHRPKNKSVIDYVMPVLTRIKKQDLVIEINSGGLRKPVSEIYPSADIVNAMFESNIGITFGSDAHHPDQVGEGLNKAYDLALKAGYRYGVNFKNRKKELFYI
ncbi:Histidinol-phosphatase [Candidatus Syntrophocurvum alkaliphilum]|uniref:Histidinol-phosphatase n=1 Tax=Candidatus Syntrophocurvum alkaliphilum TaxID=2293317 RepID=A0A6I6D7B5_9FIRM|nr:histidinol-phosphatase HisJ family protein [Candidatus Syntrophocurvum alkaliphilum]QGT99013.1 Histidinol-phosphatase [Candidatus Syntrophocurvum alkaliphilum]